MCPTWTAGGLSGPPVPRQSVLAGETLASTDCHLCWHTSAGGQLTRQHRYDLAAAQIVSGLVVVT